MIHENKSEFACKDATIRKNSTHFQVPSFGGAVIRIEDWWDRVAGKSWMDCNGNPAALVYAMRSVDNDLPADDEVLYGKINGLGHLIHISELITD